jgi:gluconate 2-dehydrogenase gamma chain
MSKSAKWTRRKFIQAAAAAAAAAPLISCNGTSSPWRFFTAEEAQTLAALCEQIIPSDQDPGAAWAGVVNFLDRQLCGPYKRFRATYRQGMAGVDESSRSLFGKRFVELRAGEQEGVLKGLEKGSAPGETWKRLSSTEFFDLLVMHTMQGFYGDPRHGGNREGVSWKMLGLAYPPIRGQLHYDLSKPNP